MDKFKTLQNFIKTHYTPKYVHFNATSYKAGTISIQSIESQRTLTSYIDGSRDVEMLFALAIVLPYDLEKSSTNTGALNECAYFISWVDAQEKARNYPEFDNANVWELSALVSVPSVVVSEDGKLAKYQINCSVKYTEH